MEEEHIVSIENGFVLRDVLVSLEDENYEHRENQFLTELKENFFGFVITSLEKLDDILSFGSDFISLGKIYLTGNVTELFSNSVVKEYKQVFVITDFVLFDENAENTEKVLDIAKISSENPEQNIKCIRYGNVPIYVDDIGIFVREFYDENVDWFNCVSTDHQFQNLTEGNKDGVAYRTGIYITSVTQIGTGLKFFLLRCSSNFTGGTDNFTDTDEKIINKTQEFADGISFSKVKLNHVLAQIYWNNQGDFQTDSKSQQNQQNDKKAVIKAHSDKTKDMPRNALMAFASFYKDYKNCRFEHLEKFGVHRSKTNPFDFVYKETSVLTTLQFVMKKEANEDPEYDEFPRKFTIPLYPNSLFIMSLSGNRIYTHEIVPSNLPVAMLPIRMGYVIRCSKTKAIHSDGKTYMFSGDELVEMTELTTEHRENLKQLYAEENKTINFVEYPFINASMNKGDYLPPTMYPKELSD